MTPPCLHSVKTWPTPVEVRIWIWTLRPIGQKFGERCTMLKKASTWPSEVSMFVFRPRLFRWVVWQYHKLTIRSTSASILTKASRGQTTSTEFSHRVLWESACYDACEEYYQRCYPKNLHWLYSTHPRIRMPCLVWRSDRKAGEVARIVLPPPSCYTSACEKTIWLPYTHLILQDYY